VKMKDTIHPNPGENVVEEDLSAIPVRVDQVTKQYFGDKFTAVDNVSLDLKENQITAFIGPSGCGKTVTLRLIAGLEYPSFGRITCFG